MIQNYQDLVVWQKGIELVKEIYRLSERFPAKQQYILTSQIQRTAISIPSNIAEGRSRHSQNDFIYHLNVARGSVAELETQLIIARELNYLTEAEMAHAANLANEITRMLHALKTSLKSNA